MVSSVNFTNVQTNSFTVNWIGPSATAHVSWYTVTWTPGSSQEKNTSKTTRADITGLTPGEKYTVTVISVNSVTQVSSLRTVSVTEEQSASKLLSFIQTTSNLLKL